MEKDHAREQAEAQLASIHEMVARFNHSLECDSDYPETICSKEYCDDDEARAAIEQDPLEVSIRSNWAGSSKDWEASDYKILLCTGGPAVRITGKLDNLDQVGTAQLEYQDWGTPWTRLPLTQEDIDALLTYAGCFYFGE